MRVVLAGPIETAALAAAIGIDLAGLPGGTAQTPLAPLAAALIARGLDVHVVTLDGGVERSETHRRGALSITFCPFRLQPAVPARWRMLDLFEREIRHLTAAIRDARPDIVHAHWTYEYAEAAVRAGLPHLVTMHDLGWDNLFLFRDAYRLMRVAMTYRTMPRVRHVSVVSPFMIRKTRHYGYLGPVDIVPNAVAAPPLDPARVASRDLAAPRIATVGNPGRLKNVAASIAAHRLLRRHLPGAELHLYGPGLDARFADPAADIVAPGNVPHAELMERLADETVLLIHPSRIETFGVVVAEAKARGVPVIGGARSGGVADVVGTAGGRLVDIRDPGAIAAAALDLLADPTRYAQDSAAAHADIACRFDPAHVAARYVDLYDNIVAKAGRRP